MREVRFRKNSLKHGSLILKNSVLLSFDDFFRHFCKSPTIANFVKTITVQAHLAHQEFIERIGDVSPVHIDQLSNLEALGSSRRTKDIRRIPNQVQNGLDQGKP